MIATKLPQSKKNYPTGLRSNNDTLYSDIFIIATIATIYGEWFLYNPPQTIGEIDLARSVFLQKYFIQQVYLGDVDAYLFIYCNCRVKTVCETQKCFPAPKLNMFRFHIRGRIECFNTTRVFVAFELQK